MGPAVSAEKSWVLPKFFPSCGSEISQNCQVEQKPSVRGLARVGEAESGFTGSHPHLFGLARIGFSRAAAMQAQPGKDPTFISLLSFW